MASGNVEQPIIKKIRKVAGGGGHHGGAWKVAYADFVTAMMAFFLLMWLLNATSEEQRKGIADFFSPSIPISSTPAGGRALFNGEDAFSSENRLDDGGGGATRGDEDAERADEDPNRRAPPPTAIETRDALDAALQEALDEDAAELSRDVADALGFEQASVAVGVATEARPTGAAADARADAAETAESDAAAERDRDAADQAEIALEAGAEATDDVEALSEDALRAAAAEQRERELEAVEAAFNALKEESRGNILLEHLSMTLTPEGLVIEIAEVDGRPLFPSGSDEPTEMLRALVEIVAPIIGELENDVALIGHTDARPFAPGSRSNNWRLSADRADAARRLLLEQGLSEARIRRISGAAEREPLTDDPFAPENRRIGIILLREPPS